LFKNQKFRDAVALYKKDTNYPEPRCLSDQGLLWLRYGMWKLTDLEGVNYLTEKYVVVDHYKRKSSMVADREEQRGEKFEDFCVRMYNDIIRGNMEYTNRSLVPAVAALLYICCIFYGVQVTQELVASSIYNIQSATLRRFYKEMLKDDIMKKELEI